MVFQFVSPTSDGLILSRNRSKLAGLRLDVLGTVAVPDRIFAGGDEALLAVRELEVGKYIVVVYREVPGDGFVITAFLTRRVRRLERRKQLWP